MIRLGRWYVLGPRVQHPDAVFESLCEMIVRDYQWEIRGLKLEDLEGPARHDSSGVPGERQKYLRHAPEVVELWTGQVLWAHAASVR